MSCSEGCLAILSRACARGLQVARTPCGVTGLKWFHILVTSLLAICGFRKDVKVIACDVVRIAPQIARREPWTTQSKCINISFMSFMSDLFWNPNALCLQQSEELNNMSQWCPSLFLLSISQDQTISNDPFLQLEPLTVIPKYSLF